MSKFTTNSHFCLFSAGAFAFSAYILLGVRFANSAGKANVWCISSHTANDSIIREARDLFIWVDAEINSLSRGIKTKILGLKITEIHALEHRHSNMRSLYQHRLYRPVEKEISLPAGLGFYFTHTRTPPQGWPKYFFAIPVGEYRHEPKMTSKIF